MAEIGSVAQLGEPGNSKSVEAFARRTPRPWMVEAGLISEATMAELSNERLYCC